MEWVGHLRFEIERRDRRQAFLWALLVTAATSTFFLARYLIWHPPHELPATASVVSIGLGAAAFAFLVTPLLERLWSEIHPDQTLATATLSRLVLYVRFIHQYGLRRRFLLDAPQTMALALVATVLFILSFNISGPWRYLGLFLAALLTLRTLMDLFALLGRHYFAASMSILILNELRQAENWEELQVKAQPLIEELENLIRTHPLVASASDSKPLQRLTTTNIERGQAFRRLLLTATAIFLLLSASTNLLPYDPLKVSVAASLAAALHCRSSA